MKYFILVFNMLFSTSILAFNTTNPTNIDCAALYNTIMIGLQGRGDDPTGLAPIVMKRFTLIVETELEAGNYNKKQIKDVIGNRTRQLGNKLTTILDPNKKNLVTGNLLKDCLAK